MTRKTYFFILSLFIVANVFAQEKPIFLNNASFEGEPNSSAFVSDWETCIVSGVPRKVNQPALLPGPFGVNLYAIDGDTYMGLMVRDNNTWESVSQKLTAPLESQWCYLFQLALAQSDYFINHSALQNQQTQFNTPISLKIYGGNDECSKKELLAETSPVNHYEWDSYTFYLCPSENYTYLTLEAYYVDDKAMTYPNGHILIDDASPLYPLPYSFGEIEWDKIPKSEYLSIEDIEQYEMLVEDYGQKVRFEGTNLPYFIYLDGYNGVRYGNLYFDAIAGALENFEAAELVVAVKPDTEGNTKKRISELKNVFREIGIQAYQYTIKAADKLANEDKWLVENDFIKMKVYK